MFNFLKNKTNRKGFICFLPFLKTGAIQYLLPTLDIVMDGMLIGVFIYLLKCWMLKKNKKIDIFTQIILVYLVALGFSTYINNGVIFYYLIIFIRISSIILYIKNFMLNKDFDFNTILLPIILLFSANIISFLLYPNGMYTMIGANGEFYSTEVWLMGGKNAYFYYIIFAITISLLKTYTNNKNISQKIKTNYILFTLCFINIFICSKSSTAIIGILFVSACFILDDKIKIKDKKWVALCFILLISMTYILVFSENNYIMQQISSFTNKDITFTGRTFIWQKTIEAIPNNLWIGHGLENAEQIIETIGQTTSHNKYLWILYCTGIIGFIVFILMLLLVMRKLYINYELPIVRKLTFCFLSILLTWNVEVYDANPLIIGVLTICFLAKEILASKFTTNSYNSSFIVK